MAVQHGFGASITEGLTFAYDTIDTTNSYLGEPTTNLFTNPAFTSGTSGWTFGSWDGGRYTYTVENIMGPFGEIVPALKVVRTTSDTSFAHFHQNNGGKFTNGNTYTISAWVKGSGTLGQYNQGGYGPITYSPSQFTTLTNAWQRVSYTLTSQTNSLYPYWAAEGITQNVPMYFTFAQAEQKPHKTQFVNGTRSATQGLLDLTGRSVIDLTNSSFNSNSQISLDGSSDYIKISQNNNFFTNQWTWEMVVNFAGNTGTYLGLVWAEGDTGGGSGLQYLLTLYDHTYFHYRINNSITGWANTDTATINFNPSNYTHIVWQFNNGVTNLYVNGALFHTNSGRGSYIGGTNSPMFIGARNDGAYSSIMQPHLVKHYNRILSQNEVTQNFKKYQTRFGIA
jgi:hypothetical protein